MKRYHVVYSRYEGVTVGRAHRSIVIAWLHMMTVRHVTHRRHTVWMASKEFSV